MPRRSPGRRPKQPSTASLLVEAALLSRVGLRIVQVGANLGDFDRSHHTRLARDDPVREAMLRLLEADATHAVLVEANPPVHAALQEGLRRSASAQRHATANVAVCTQARSGTAHFYTVLQDRLLRDFPQAPRWARSELSSLDSRSVLAGVGLVVGRENASRYVGALDVPCLTPSDLLRNVSIPPSALDVLVVDAEGSDVGIVQAFFDAAARPRLIFFEIDTARYHEKAQTRKLLAQLVRSGYHVYCCGCGGYFPPGFRKKGEADDKRCDAARNAFAWDPAALGMATVLHSGKFEWGGGGRRRGDVA